MSVVSVATWLNPVRDRHGPSVRRCSPRGTSALAVQRELFGEQLQRGGGEGDHVARPVVVAGEHVAGRGVGPATAIQQCPAGSPYGFGGPAAPASDSPHVEPSWAATDAAR